MHGITKNLAFSISGMKFEAKIVYKRTQNSQVNFFLYDSLSVNSIIAAIGTALYSLYKTNETFRNGVNNAWNNIKTVITGVCDSVKSQMEGKFKPAIESVKQIAAIQIKFLENGHI